MPRKPKIPAYSLHKPSGLAVVKVKQRSIYLGEYGSDESREAYARIIADLLAGRPITPQAAPKKGNPTLLPTITVAELAAQFRRYAEGYYRKGGDITSEVYIVRRAMEFLLADHAGLPVAEFTIGDLKVVRQAIVETGVSRTVANKYIGRIKRAFTWGATEELVPASVPHALLLLPGLKAGRTAAKETLPVQPVGVDVVEATVKRVNNIVADMVKLQLLTGMRPDEVCTIRPVDIDRSSEVWEYNVDGHKTEHHGKRRTVFIGPVGQAILTPYLLRPEEEYCFRPKRHTPVPRAKRRYRVDSYRQAIKRAAKRAGVPHWSPNQLRHTAATEVRKRFGLETVQVVLGHSKANTTELYAERDVAKGIEVVSPNWLRLCYSTCRVCGSLPHRPAVHRGSHFRHGSRRSPGSK